MGTPGISGTPTPAAGPALAALGTHLLDALAHHFEVGRVALFVQLVIERLAAATVAAAAVAAAVIERLAAAVVVAIAVVVAVANAAIAFHFAHSFAAIVVVIITLYVVASFVRVSSGTSRCRGRRHSEPCPLCRTLRRR